jgi:hypothetical protein
MKIEGIELTVVNPTELSHTELENFGQERGFSAANGLSNLQAPQLNNPESDA